MKKYFALLAFFGFAPTFSLAVVSIQDPHGVFEQLQEKLSTPTFDSLFRVGESAIFDSYVESCEISCSDPAPGELNGCASVCKERPQEVTRSVLKIDENGNAVVYGKEDGFYEEISPETINTCRGNLAQKFIANLDVQLNLTGSVVLTKLSSFEFPLAQGTPRARKVTAYSVWGNFTIQGLKTPFEFKVSVVPSAPGVGQIALFTAVGTPHFKLKDF